MRAILRGLQARAFAAYLGLEGNTTVVFIGCGKTYSEPLEVSGHDFSRAEKLQNQRGL
jgi:hypothetical protein